MWPFKRKNPTPPPVVVSSDGIRSHYDTRLEQWVFHQDGIYFTVRKLDFDVRAFDWAKEAAVTVNRIRPEMMPVVFKWLGEYFDHSKAELFSVDLTQYGEAKTMEVAFTGEDYSWADFGVDVVVRDGQIVDSYAGD